MSFVRRFSAFPSLSTITAIEGAVIVDQTPAGVFVGVGEQTACMVGEFTKGPYNTPTEIFGDPTIRSVFGGFSLAGSDPLSFSTNPWSNGNGFVALKGKSFFRLILVRASMELANGVSLSIASNPSVAATGSITAVGGGSIIDGETFTVPDGINAAIVFEFDSGGGVLPGHVAVPFTGADSAATVAASIQTAINGVVAGLRVTAGAPVGAVVGLMNDFPGIQGNLAITETVANAGFLVAGMSGGTGFAFLSADLTVPAGTRVRNPAVPNQEFATSQDVVFAVGTDVSTVASSAFVFGAKNSTKTVTAVPVVSTQGNAAIAAVVTQVDSTDLLLGGIGPGSSNPQVVISVTNPSSLTPLTGAQVDANYANAITSTLPGDDPSNAINILWSARQSANIRVALQANVVTSSQTGLGRLCCIRPPIGTLEGSASGQLFSSLDPGVAAYRSDRVVYCYPHFSQFISDLPSLLPSSTGNVLVGADSAMAMLMSNLAPEENPGQSTGLIEFILGMEPNLTGANMPTKFQLADYIAFKAQGVACLFRDPRLAAWEFESGVTAVDPTFFPTLSPINRRRMADFIEDSLAAISLKYVKKPGTTDRKDSLLGEMFDFLDTLEAPNNPAQQRIDSFSLDSKSGNTDQLSGLGIYVIVAAVRMLGDLDNIVVEATIGATVSVTATP